MTQQGSARSVLDRLLTGPWPLTWPMVTELLSAHVLSVEAVAPLARKWMPGLTDDERVQLALAEDEGPDAQRRLVARLAGTYDPDTVWEAIACNLVSSALRDDGSARSKADTIATLWAEVGHPAAWAPFIAYMPATDPAHAGLPKLLHDAARWVETTSPPRCRRDDND